MARAAPTRPHPVRLMDVTATHIYCALRGMASASLRGAGPSYLKFFAGSGTRRKATAHVWVEALVRKLHVVHKGTGRAVPAALWLPCVDRVDARFAHTLETFAGFVIGIQYRMAARGCRPQQVARCGLATHVEIQFECMDAWARGCSLPFLAMGCTLTRCALTVPCQ